MKQARLDIINILKEFKPSDDQGVKDVKFIEKMVTKHENIFVRECLDGHLTASALVVNPKTGMVLLHNHKKLNKWLQFGGHEDGSGWEVGSSYRCSSQIFAGLRLVS
jgi:hypothetical protein